MSPLVSQKLKCLQQNVCVIHRNIANKSHVQGYKFNNSKNQLNFDYYFALQYALVSLKSLAPRSKGSRSNFNTRSSWDCHSLSLSRVRAEVDSSPFAAANHMRYFDGWDCPDWEEVPKEKGRCSKGHNKSGLGLGPTRSGGSCYNDGVNCFFLYFFLFAKTWVLYLSPLNKLMTSHVNFCPLDIGMDPNSRLQRTIACNEFLHSRTSFLLLTGYL